MQSTFTVTIAEWFANKTLIKEGDPSPIGIFRHAWWPTRFNFTDFHIVLRVVRNNINGIGGYVVTKYSSPFDKWILSQYLHSGFKGCKTNVKIEGMEDDFFIHGDVIFQVNLSDETKKTMDKYYEEITDIKDLYNFYKNKTTLQKIQIEVKIFRNLQLAETLRNIVKKEFGEEK